MRSIVRVLLLTLILVFPGIVLAAPSANITTNPARQFVNLTFTDLGRVSRVSYTLVYDTTQGEKGFAGGFKVSPKTRRVTKRQILGTCSSGRCVYHKNSKNLQLEVTYTLRSGGQTTSTRVLP